MTWKPLPWGPAALGNLYRTRGELDQAEEMLKKSLAIAEKLGFQEGTAATYGHLGVIYQTRGELDRAEEMLKKSLAINEKLGRQEGKANQYAASGTSTGRAASSTRPDCDVIAPGDLN